MSGCVRRAARTCYNIVLSRPCWGLSMMDENSPGGRPDRSPLVYVNDISRFGRSYYKVITRGGVWHEKSRPQGGEFPRRHHPEAAAATRSASRPVTAVNLKRQQEGPIVDVAGPRQGAGRAGRPTARRWPIAGEDGARLAWRNAGASSSSGHPRRRLAASSRMMPVPAMQPHPCVILSPPEIHDHLGLVTVAPVTPERHPRRPIACLTILDNQASLIRLDQIRTVEKRALTRQVGAVERKTLAARAGDIARNVRGLAVSATPPPAR